MERISQSDERQYTLQELADSAGVSIRTIRYYIGEGLLPGPEGAGPQSHYAESHARRLLAIALLKDRFLPLREIRKQLTGLDDAAIDRLIIDLGGPEQAELASDDVVDGAMAPGFESMPQLRFEDTEPRYDTNALDYIDGALSRPPTRFRGVREDRGRRSVERHDESARWRRIEVADGAELLIREDIYQRRRDRIDWLVDWAKKVVD